MCDRLCTKDAAQTANRKGTGGFGFTKATFPTKRLRSENQDGDVSPFRKKVDHPKGAKPKQVRFDATTKGHDGLKPPSLDLDAVVCAFYQGGSVNTPVDLLELSGQQPQPIDFPRVWEAIAQLVIELGHLQTVRCKTPVLRKGGGHGFLLKQAHQPSLIQLRDMCEQAAQLAKTTTASPAIDA